MYLIAPKILHLVGMVVMCLAVSACALIGGGADLERASGYSVTAPDTWSRRGRAESDRAYQLPSGNIATLISSCNRNPGAPLDILTRHLLMGTRDVSVKTREKKTLGPNEGLYSKVQTHLEGKTFHLEIFVLAKDKCIFDFTLVSPKEISGSESQEFQEYISSFRYGKD